MFGKKKNYIPGKGVGSLGGRRCYSLARGKKKKKKKGLGGILGKDRATPPYLITERGLAQDYEGEPTYRGRKNENCAKTDRGKRRTSVITTP